MLILIDEVPITIFSLLGESLLMFYTISEINTVHSVFLNNKINT